MAAEKLSDFLREQCLQRSLSLRSLSIKAGLSPGTVHSIINREYQPTLYSLNQLADFLDVKREYLWQLAGLLEDVDGAPETRHDDPQLAFLVAQVYKLPEPAKKLVRAVIAVMLTSLTRSTTNTEVTDAPVDVEVGEVGVE